MKSTLFFILLFLLSGGVHALHSLKVKIVPSEHQIVGEDEITFDEQIDHFQFSLLESLVIDKIESASLVESESLGGFKTYKVKLAKAAQRIVIKYYGTIYDSPIEKGDSQGTIQSEGVALFEGSGWFPTIDGWLTPVRLSIRVPAGWSTISVGDLESSQSVNDWNTDTWIEKNPQQGIQLFANQWTQYQAQQNGYKAYVYLRAADNDLAQTYLNTTFTYLKKYEELFGPYAYNRFSLAENFWETGYGMPGFTLLGSQVIRLPFLTQTSYPHEILHNWWGNGVYVDYESGNWCEGLTAYLADHLIASESGQGEEYRRTTLEGFKNFVNSENDFPLKDFRSRHNEAEQAIGYGKGLMFFHMLRLQLGDELFFKGLKKFYADFKFKVSGYLNILQVMQEVSGQDLNVFFSQWVNEKGSPRLELKNVQLISTLNKNSKKWSVQFEVVQDKNYLLKIPVQIIGADRESFAAVFYLSSNQQQYKVDLDFNPKKIIVDPKYDVFRSLYDAEVPPTISKTFGNRDPILFIIPHNSLAENFVKSIKDNFDSAKIIFDDEPLPMDAKRVWVLGWDNKFLPEIQKRSDIYGVKWTKEGIDGSVQAQKSKHAVNLILEDWNWSATADESFWGRLAAKTPHYGKFSYLVFDGEKNILKGAWPVKRSPLVYEF